jgi:toxin ParE1/3/4
MPRYILTDHAKADLREIISFIRRDSRQAAKQSRAEFNEVMRKLAEFPLMGHTREDAEDDSLRFWTVYSYLIVYRPGVKPLRILRVIHGARDVGGALRRGH